MDEDSSPSRSPSRSHAVGVSLCDSAPLLWRVEDLRSVRSEGLVGALLGSLPRTPRQNVRLGRPLLLLPEEETLLTERHAVATAEETLLTERHAVATAEETLLTERHAVATAEETLLTERHAVATAEETLLTERHAVATAEETLLTERHAVATAEETLLTERQVQQHQEEQQRSYEEQSVLALEDRKSALLRAMTSSRTESGAGPGDEALRSRLEALDRSFTFPRSALAVQLSTARAGLSYCPEARAFLRAERPMRGRSCDGARYQVFRDLRGRGFYLTSAGKFGGDFLVYPGDPLRFHAHFIGVCLSVDQSVCLLDVLAVARLGSNVKKTVLLCSPGTDGRVLYTSLQWSGMV
ncbi:tRNA-splicing endonuclease subunit Sen34-like [Sebastes fasciatus]|uniref:tRNA-splicing endonuclease subunit Sen34-like n=1 Tax=Sebastes fasciatus TaxID=394691 RepID=UPI003D9E0FF1